MNLGKKGTQITFKIWPFVNTIQGYIWSLLSYRVCGSGEASGLFENSWTTSIRIHEKNGMDRLPWICLSRSMVRRPQLSLTLRKSRPIPSTWHRRYWKSKPADITRRQGKIRITDSENGVHLRFQKNRKIQSGFWHAFFIWILRDFLCICNP